MAKKTEQKEAGEQLDLIEVGPENAKEIGKIARAYERVKRERMKWTEKEVEQKTALSDLIHKANLKPLDDGTIRFKVDKLIVTVKPKKESITVREEGEPEEGGDE